MALRIRPFAASDTGRLRSICCETAAERPFLPWVEEPRFASVFFLETYLELESASCFVAELDGHIIGYLVGTRNAKRFWVRENILLRRRLHQLLQIYVAGLVNKRFRHYLNHVVLAKTCCRILLGRLHRSTNSGYFDLDRFPANCHLQVVPGARGAGAGLALLLKFGEYLKANGVHGVHGSVVEEAGHENFSRMLVALGLRVIHEKQFTSRECPTLIHSGIWKERVLVGDF